VAKSKEGGRTSQLFPISRIAQSSQKKGGERNSKARFKLQGVRWAVRLKKGGKENKSHNSASFLKAARPLHKEEGARFFFKASVASICETAIGRGKERAVGRPKRIDYRSTTTKGGGGREYTSLPKRAAEKGKVSRREIKI